MNLPSGDQNGNDAPSVPGRFIAFFASGKLKTIDTVNGTAQVLCDAVAGRGGSWNADGTLVFTGQVNSPISRIAASGGIATPVTTLDPGKRVIAHLRDPLK